MMTGRASKIKPREACAKSVLLVGPQSASVDRRKALLEASGFEVTLAENICHAEVFSETQHFDAAVYDESLASHEQVSLAGVMRIRWPWMRLVASGPTSLAELFDGSESLEAELPRALGRILASPSHSQPRESL
jgi:hypothetical protein